ncbi:cytochrome P450 26C1 [Protopterus annectens]|uniref:cytochrome P450 26C1 n=1 Tax=Protopterus annectens TaxID=7888 RepID=UPI001CFA6C43|nr:cytochrome P450 26C1 [Protopterus annectens]
MFLIGQLSYLALLESTIASFLSLLLLLALARQLWTLKWNMKRDRDNKLPLPQGSMGWPLLGETLHWFVQGSSFHVSRRKKYGNVFKTHLLGKPVIRVTGAENIRKILLGEHTLVSTQWPQSTRIILGCNNLANSIGELHRQNRKILSSAFSHTALEHYLPRIQMIVHTHIQNWCREQGPIAVFPSSKAFTFRIAVRVLLGLDLEEKELQYLAKTFEQLMDNLFSLPLDIPFSGLRKGIKARDVIHRCIEKAIKEKLQKKKCEGYTDALDFMINGAKEHGRELSMQELKELSVELIFAAFFTTASASTSLILLLLKEPRVISRLKQELVSFGLSQDQDHLQPAVTPMGCKKQPTDCHKEDQISANSGGTVTQPAGSQRHMCSHKDCTVSDASGNTDRSHFSSHSVKPKLAEDGCTCNGTQKVTSKDQEQESISQKKMYKLCTNGHLNQSYLKNVTQGCSCQPQVTLDTLKQLPYLDCIIKEVLRILPPVSGGYRTVLQTFELDGYQIPKDWSVMYSIRDTHETAAAFQNPEVFDPDRFGPERAEEKVGRFNYIPFGGGVRSCIGKELAQIILKSLAIELVNTAKWELASNAFPKMQTVPIVYPVDGLQLYFHSLKFPDA